MKRSARHPVLNKSITIIQQHSIVKIEIILTIISDPDPKIKLKNETYFPACLTPRRDNFSVFRMAECKRINALSHENCEDRVCGATKELMMWELMKNHYVENRVEGEGTIEVR